MKLNTIRFESLLCEGLKLLMVFRRRKERLVKEYRGEEVRG